MNPADVPADALAEATMRELLDRVLALPKVEPRSAAQCTLRNVARLLAIEHLAREGLDDAVNFVTREGFTSHADAFVAVRDWARLTIDEIVEERRTA